MFMSELTLWYFNFASFGTLVIVNILYFAQIALYKPQFKNHIPASVFTHFLNMKPADLGLSYFDSIMIREGPELDPSKTYMFGWMPHGILGICRAASGGSAWG